MSKKYLLGTLLILLMVPGSSGRAQEQGSKLGIDLDTTFVSKYLWRGYDLFDDKGAWQPSINYDILGTGFNANVWGSFPIGSGNENWTELDYTFGYGHTFFEEEKYALEIGGNYIYYDYPKLNRFADTQEIGVGIALPRLISFGEIALVPGYYGGKLWPTKGQDDVAGGVHILSLNCDIPVPCPIRKDVDQVFSLFTDLTYNDGAFNADHDWSHATVGLSTGFAIGPVTVTPALYYQKSMDDSVNNEDELWGGLSVSYSF